MSVFRRVLSWFGGKAALFLLLVAAILFYSSARTMLADFSETRRVASELGEGRQTLAQFIANQTEASDTAIARAHGWTQAELTTRIASAEREQAALQKKCGADLAALLKGGASGVIENRRDCIHAALLAREVEALATMRSTLDARRPGETIPEALNRLGGTMRQADAARADALRRISEIDEHFLGWLRFAQERESLVARADEATRDRQAAERSQRSLVQAQGALDGAAARARGAVAQAESAYQRLAAGEAGRLSGNAFELGRRWAERHDVAGAMRAAALVLLGIIVMPYLIRLLFYFVLAPTHRSSIRLRVPGGMGSPIAMPQPSTTSVAVRLEQGEELLVRQGYLQSTSCVGAKSTRWLLDGRHPISSIAAGLTFLTRIAGEGELTTVSAISDPFAEVTIIALPERSACVLQPRALAGVAHPIGRKLRITSHWRLLSLNAWLTMQLRYLVFHGPARLIVKGGRGVRVERAMHGRILGQDQLVGFSADLNYSVTRTETFWPYFLGRESLLKDRVEAGDGMLIVEEAPLAGRKAGQVRRGLEGAMDVALKAVGL
jgi:hypothetical protein